MSLHVHAMSYQSCSTLSDPMDYSLPESTVPGIPPGENVGADCHAFLQDILQSSIKPSSLMSSALGRQIPCY